MKEVSSATVIRDLQLLSHILNKGRREWGLENITSLTRLSNQ